MTQSLVIAVSLLVILVAGLLIFTKYNAPKIAPPDAQSNSELRYAALGDSYTIGEGENESNRWPNQLVAQLQAHGTSIRLVTNPSRTGYTTEDLLDKEVKPLQQSNANFITILIGVNDYVRGVSSSEFQKRFKKVLDTVQATAPQAKILVVTIPDYGKTPSGAQFGVPARTEVGLKAYNQIIIDEAGRRNLPVADIFAISQVSSTAGELVGDGLHPSGAQYAKWLEIIAPQAEKLLKN